MTPLVMEIRRVASFVVGWSTAEEASGFLVVFRELSWVIAYELYKNLSSDVKICTLFVCIFYKKL